MKNTDLAEKILRNKEDGQKIQEFIDDYLSEIANYLECLANGTITPKNENCGLCKELWYIFGVKTTDLVDIRMWPKFSGNIKFPITINGKPQIEYEYIYDCNKWGDDEYGNVRRELCAWIASKLRERILTRSSEKEAKRNAE